MDEKCKKAISLGAPCVFSPSVPGANVAPASCTPVKGKVDEACSARMVFGIQGGGAITDSSSHQEGIDFGASHTGYGPRFDIPGPMMRTVRDPSLLLIAMGEVDPEGPVMVEIPPVSDASHLRHNLSLAGSRIGFASEYVSGDVRETIEHSEHFALVLNSLRIAGAQLVPVHAFLVDDSRHFTLDLSNEINDRVTENRLDVLVSDTQSAAFHRAATSGNPSVCVPTGTDADGVTTSVWFYGAHWAGDRLASLVQGYQQVLLQV